MKTIIKRLSNPRVILLLVILVLINLALFSIPTLAGSRPRILASAPGFTVPDMKGFYSPDYVNDFLTAIGPEGRHAYQMMHFTTDLAFPLLYSALLFAVLGRLTDSKTAINTYLPWFAVLPFISDLAENFIMVSITAKFPEFHPGLTRVAQVFTLLKFGGILLCVLMMVVLSVRRKNT